MEIQERKKCLCSFLCCKSRVSVKENPDTKKIFFLSFQANRKTQIIVTINTL